VRISNYRLVLKVFDVNIVGPAFCVLRAAFMMLEYSIVYTLSLYNCAI
jgi:hypothetical protein